MADDRDTGITLAVLGAKMDGADKQRDRIEGKINAINDTVDAHSQRITRVEERVGILALAEGAFSVVTSSIAAYLGMRR